MPPPPFSFKCLFLLHFYYNIMERLCQVTTLASTWNNYVFRPFFYAIIFPAIFWWKQVPCQKGGSGKILWHEVCIPKYWHESCMRQIIDSKASSIWQSKIWHMTSNNWHRRQKIDTWRQLFDASTFWRQYFDASTIWQWPSIFWHPASMFWHHATATRLQHARTPPLVGSVETWIIHVGHSETIIRVGSIENFSPRLSGRVSVEFFQGSSQVGDHETFFCRDDRRSDDCWDHPRSGVCRVDHRNFLFYKFLAGKLRDENAIIPSRYGCRDHRRSGTWRNVMQTQRKQNSCNLLK